MAKRRKKANGRSGPPRIVGPGLTEASPLSLPPAVVSAALATSPPPVKGSPEDTRIACPTCKTLTKAHTCPNGHAVPQPDWRLPDDSIVRTRAMQIIAFRLGGMEDAEIAKYLKISPKSIGPYIYRAGKNGWLSFNSSREAIEFGMAHKVLRNIDELLEARDKETTLEVAKGTMFKEFGAEGQVAPITQTAISIRIEQPKVAQPMRPGTIGGMDDVIDVEVSE